MKLADVATLLSDIGFTHDAHLVYQEAFALPHGNDLFHFLSSVFIVNLFFYLKARELLDRYEDEEWDVTTTGTAQTYSVVLDAFDEYDPDEF